MTELETTELEKVVETPSPEPESETEPESEAESEPVRSRGGGARGARGAEREARQRYRSKRRRVLIGIATACVVILGLYGVSQVPAVNTVLRQSFTQLPAPYTEMYFSGTPTVNGILLEAPVTVINHATTADSFVLKVWMTNAAGKREAATSLTVTPKHGEAKIAVKVSVQLPPDAQVLWISLAGQTQTLHYRIAGVAIPTPTATPKSTAGAKATPTAAG